MVLVAVVTGCQSGGQHDVVVRELRMQEDQLYALENYLEQYQQLVRKYRSENSALRRELAEARGETDGVPPAREPARSESPSKGGGPSLSEPAIPPPRGTPMQPEPDGVEEPQIPPLETPPLENPPPAESPSAESAVNEPAGTLASAAPGKATLTQVNFIERNSTVPSAAGQQSRTAWLRGEVRANETGGGPRLVVDVEVGDALDDIAGSGAALSIMLLTRDGEATPQSLARWDFLAEEVNSSVTSADGRTFWRFYLELPDDSAAVAPAQIWARCLRPNGEKTLVHADIDLLSPSTFSSRAMDDPGPAAGQQSLTSGPESSETAPARVLWNLDEDEWTIARPGEPAVGKLLGNAQDSWRTASEPIPTPKRVVPAVPLASTAPSVAEKTGTAAPQQPYRRPTWSPDRVGDGPVTVDVGTRPRSSASSRPAWSPTR